MKVKVLMCAAGFVVGLLVVVTVFATVVRPRRVNFAYVGGDEPLLIDYGWWLSVAGGGVVGAVAGLLLAISIVRRRRNP
ncbi:hypothetical protein GCM10007304_46570 [Rhodococcoides trifolii]|uniref:Uncharacterized protein n=1 Tax=Rhodococcoides trifolii TaxID=908250 RepID=A0A917LIR7_9NOCA|nr:hypothetical protein [Rhodococcus trifolii]GGG27413.1 hypothetical protein GCM10007304_46570 [Rhodococcus trifolii]